MSGTVKAYQTRAQAQKLFDAANPAIDPEGLISRYLEFEFYRFKQDLSFAINGNLTERLKVLHWYLAGYGPHRNLPLPLSKQQIDFLNTPVPIIGLGLDISIAAFSFITNELGPNRDLRDDNVLRESLYWWCVQRAPKLAPHGELVTPPQIRTLTYTDQRDVGRKFPLNYFARRTWELDGSLQQLNLEAALDRAVLVCILMLRCVDTPFYAQFLPRASVAELLSTRSGEKSGFEQILGKAIGEDEAHELRVRLETHLTASGFSFVSSARDQNGAHAGNIALSLHRDPQIARGLEPGIAVIGPTRATSGLGQATRLSVDVLKHIDRDPVVYDFGLDNPAPIGFTTSNKTKALRVPRQINLIHLNAESIPLAFAFIDHEVHRRSYNIGYFFWELTEIPKCHRLALDMLDEIWVSSEYNREIYSRFAKIPVHNVGMAVEPLPEAAPLSRQQLGIAEDAFVFLSTFDSFSFVERKNPLGVLAAFQAAFPLGSSENVALILKTQNRTRVGDPHQVRIWQTIDDVLARDPRIRVIDQTLSYRDLLGFKRACDCYVSLHRSEGWGFGMIEAMQLNLPVVTTGYSGNMDFCSPETAFLVDYELVSPMPHEYIFVERGSLWADPSMASAAAALREVYANPGAAKARADAAFRNVQDSFSIAAIGNRYQARLTEIQAIIDTTDDAA